MRIIVGLLNPSPACIICLCVPSPQSSRMSSPSLRRATLGNPLSLVGRLPPVPRKTTSIPPDISLPPAPVFRELDFGAHRHHDDLRLQTQQIRQRQAFSYRLATRQQLSPLNTRW